MSFNFKAGFTDVRRFEIMIRKTGMIQEDWRRGIRQAFYRFGKRVRTDMIEDIKVKRSFFRYPSGRTNRYYFRGKIHYASRPGESPAKRSGDLIRSIDFNANESRLLIGYDTTVNYGGWLEEGTGKMEPRPAIRNNIEKNSRNGFYEKTAEQEISKALNAKGR